MSLNTEVKMEAKEELFLAVEKNGQNNVNFVCESLPSLELESPQR